jgi:hypothetical protein
MPAQRREEAAEGWFRVDLTNPSLGMTAPASPSWRAPRALDVRNGGSPVQGRSQDLNMGGCATKNNHVCQNIT